MWYIITMAVGSLMGFVSAVLLVGYRVVELRGRLATQITEDCRTRHFDFVNEYMNLFVEEISYDQIFICDECKESVAVVLGKKDKQ